MELMELIETYYPIASALVGMAMAQSIKTLLFLNRSDINVNLKTLFTAGGMPSTHSALVMGLSTAIGLKHGIQSDLFFISIIFSAIVLYDATGIRQAVGKQAVIVNKIADDYKKTKVLEAEPLSELLGHTPQEVFMGAIVGILSGLILYTLL